MRLFNVAAAALGLAFAAVPARAAYLNLSMTAEGVITYSDLHCDWDMDCDLSGYAPVGTPWKATLDWTIDVAMVAEMTRYDAHAEYYPYQGGALSYTIREYYLRKYTTNMQYSFEISHIYHFNSSKNPFHIMESSAYLQIEAGSIKRFGFANVDRGCPYFGVSMNDGAFSIWETMRGELCFGDHGYNQTDGSGQITSFEATGLFSEPLPRNTIPEPATWAMMIAGFGLIGTVARRQRREVAAAMRLAR